jgi:hypothetical protein
LANNRFICNFFSNKINIAFYILLLLATVPLAASIVKMMKNDPTVSGSQVLSIDKLPINNNNQKK